MTTVADDLDPAAVERATEVLTTHQRRDSASCLCGWSRLGHSFAQHQADMLAAAGLLVTPEHDAQVAARALRNWGQEMLARYPEGVFVEPDENGWRFIALALARQARTLDAVSASLMRRAAKLAIEDADRIERQEGER